MSEAARWKLERGATVGLLEQLMGSRTVGATALMILELRSLSLLSALLLVVWALSPLGAQSLLRVVKLRVDEVIEPSTVVYFDNSAESKIAEMADDELYGYGKPTYDTIYRIIASLYLSSVMASQEIKTDTMDLWGNVKIPFLSEMAEGGGGWTNMPQDARSTQYSSLVGVPIKDTNVDANTTFSLESEYVHLHCSNLTLDTSADRFYIRRSDKAYSGIETGMIEDAFGYQDTPFVKDRVYKLPNGTWHGYNLSERDTSWSLSLDRFVNPWWTGDNGTDLRHSRKVLRTNMFAGEDGIEAGPTNLRLDALCTANGNNITASLRTYCRVTQRYVESRVRCSRAVSTRQDCKVVAQRPSRMKHAARDISYLSFPSVFRVISRELPRAIGGSIAYQKEASLYYIQDPSVKGLRETEVRFLKDVTAEDVSVRLAQLLNTYVQLSKLYLNVTGGSSAEGVVFDSNVTAPAETGRDIVLYDISVSWAALCLASSLVLLGAGISSVVFKHKAKGPEVLGHASTVLRDSRYMEMDPGSEWMDGMELSRSMKEQRVRFGFVRAKDNGEPRVGVSLQHETEGIDVGRQ